VGGSGREWGVEGKKDLSGGKNMEREKSWEAFTESCVWETVAGERKKSLHEKI